MKRTLLAGAVLITAMSSSYAMDNTYQLGQLTARENLEALLKVCQQNLNSLFKEEEIRIYVVKEKGPKEKLENATKKTVTKDLKTFFAEYLKKTFPVLERLEERANFKEDDKLILKNNVKAILWLLEAWANKDITIKIDQTENNVSEIIQQIKEARDIIQNFFDIE